MGIVERFAIVDRVAVVTGASSGIGQSLAVALADAGADVVCVARGEAGLAETCSQIEARGRRAAACPFDLADMDAVADGADRLGEPFGAPHILVNAAGINDRQSAEAVSPAKWRRSIELNLGVPFFLAQALVPGMMAHGWGRVLNIGSLQSVRAFPDSVPYGSAKGGVVQLTRAMAEAWSSQGVNCNAIAPGFFRTPLTEAVFDDPARAERNAAQTAIGRNGELEDLHGAAVFLTSPASDYITGQTLFVDGGFTAK
jgi:gluconate 5-dehydrogenase